MQEWRIPYFEDRENIVSEEICEYAVIAQRIAEHKRSNYNTNTRYRTLFSVAFLLLGFSFYDLVVRKIHLAACK